MIPFDRPPHAEPAIRVYLDIPGGSVLQLMPVAGLSVWEPCDDDPTRLQRVPVIHAFGPAHVPLPPDGAIVRVEPAVPNVRIVVRRYADPFGCVRFAAACPVNQTNN